MDIVPLAPAGLAVVTVVTIFLFLVAVAVSLRIWALQTLQRPYHYHDVLIFVGLLLAFGQYIIHILSSRVITASSIDYVNFVKIFVADRFVRILAANAIRFSVLLFYLGLFGANARFRRTVHCVFAVTILFMAGFITTTSVFCRPFAKNWAPEIPGTCSSNTASNATTPALNVLIDIVVVVLPIPVVWRLHMDRRKRLRLLSLFFIGAVVCLVDLVRLITAVTMDAKDVTYNEGPAGILTSLEIQIGIVNACLPTIYAGFKHRTEGSSRSNTRYPYGYGGSACGPNRPYEHDSHALERRGPSMQTLVPVKSREYGIDTTIVGGPQR